jgi:hypothetical protein
VPPHAAHRGAYDDGGGQTCLRGGRAEEEEGVLAMATPASMPSPADATAIAATIVSPC